MPRPKRFDRRLDFSVEQEFVDHAERVADRLAEVTGAAVPRQDAIRMAAMAGFAEFNRWYAAHVVAQRFDCEASTEYGMQFLGARAEEAQAEYEAMVRREALRLGTTPEAMGYSIPTGVDSLDGWTQERREAAADLLRRAEAALRQDA